MPSHNSASPSILRALNRGSKDCALSYPHGIGSRAVGSMPSPNPTRLDLGPVGPTSALSQRDSVFQPRVAGHRLPWVASFPLRRAPLAAQADAGDVHEDGSLLRRVVLEHEVKIMLPSVFRDRNPDARSARGIKSAGTAGRARRPGHTGAGRQSSRGCIRPWRIRTGRRRRWSYRGPPLTRLHLGFTQQLAGR